MKKSKNIREFAHNIAEIYKTNPSEVGQYMKGHNVCFRVGASHAQFTSDLELCLAAGRVDLVEYIIGRDMHVAFALWAMSRKPADVVSEFFNKAATQAAITLLALNSMK